MAPQAMTTCVADEPTLIHQAFRTNGRVKRWRPMTSIAGLTPKIDLL